ncbi:MAG: TetR/AcrR family transcriptional regulator [Kofleriaceae bacterium]
MLEAALALFWKNGYEATSLADLVEATGLAKGSLYKGFGDKRTLFIRALDSYLTAARAALRDRARAASAFEALRSWMVGAAEMATCSGVRRGCMAVNCAIELGPHDEEVRRLLRDHEQLLERSYVELIQRSIAEGKLRKMDPETAARWITTIIGGLQVRGKLGISRAQALEAVDLALGALAPH